MKIESLEKAAAPRLWRAGDLSIDAGRQRIERGDEVILLPKLSFDLLLALIQAAPNFVSNDELMSQVWPGLVVSPETVTQRVKLLRDALRDDPRQPRYIEGLRARGYRILPEVVRAHPAVDAPLPVAAPPESRRPKRWLLAAGLVAAVATAGWFSVRNGTPLVQDTQASLTERRFERTVAVLPFISLGTNDSDAYLGPSLAESVLNRLASVNALTVIARDSSFRAQPADSSLRDTARLLNARYFITGSVQKSADLLRVNVRLVDSTADKQLWAQQFDRKARDLFALQDEIARGATQALESRVVGLDVARASRERSPNPEAYLAFLRGRWLLGRFTIRQADLAAREFVRAVELDPEFGPAHAALYDARMQAAALRRDDMTAAREMHRPIIERAIELSADSGAALFARAMWGVAEPAKREADFRLAMQMDPSNSRGIVAFAEFLPRRTRFEESQALIERALNVDPQSAPAHYRRARFSFRTVGAAVQREMLKVLELDPVFYPALQNFAKYRWLHNGDLAYAASLVERAIADDPENPVGRNLAAAIYLDLDDLAAAEDVIANNRVTSVSTKPLLEAFKGNWRGAGEAGFHSGVFEFGDVDSWLVTASLRDLALKSAEKSDVARVESVLLAKTRLTAAGIWQQQQIDAFNFRPAQQLAHLQLVQGNRAGGEQHLRDVIAWIDANELIGPVYNFRTKAQALMLMGKTDAALELLAESFKQRDYTHWWYSLEHDPTWASVRRDPRFQRIKADVKTYVAKQQAELARYRTQGVVPRRPTRK